MKRGWQNITPTMQLMQETSVKRVRKSGWIIPQSYKWGTYPLSPLLRRLWIKLAKMMQQRWLFTSEQPGAAESGRASNMACPLRLKSGRAGPAQWAPPPIHSCLLRPSTRRITNWREDRKLCFLVFSLYMLRVESDLYIACHAAAVT